MRPASDDYASYYERYVSLVPEEEVIPALEQQSTETQRLLAGLDEARASYRYEEGKWSVKQVLGHVIDAERVFAHRALTFARGDSQPLPGFDEAVWAENGSFDAWPLNELSEEYALVRRANIVLFRNLPKEAWDRRGIASDNSVSVRALAWIMVGHERHHLAVLRDRYHL